jgi:hypothetical protein
MRYPVGQFGKIFLYNLIRNKQRPPTFEEKIEKMLLEYKNNSYLLDRKASLLIKARAKSCWTWTSLVFREYSLLDD